MRQMTVIQLVNRYVTDHVFDVQIQHRLVGPDGSSGGANQQIDVFLDDGRNGGNLGLIRGHRMLSDLEGLVVGIQQTLQRNRLSLGPEGDALLLAALNVAPAHGVGRRSVGLLKVCLTLCSEDLNLAGGRMFIMPKAFPEEFRRDVVAVARKGESPITQIAKDFGISPAALHLWMTIADKKRRCEVRVSSRSRARIPS